MGFELRSDSKLMKVARENERLPRIKEREQLSKNDLGSIEPRIKGHMVEALQQCLLVVHYAKVEHEGNLQIR